MSYADRVRCRIKDLLNTDKKIVLNQLQAGRVINEYGANVPYRLSNKELELLKDKYIYYWDDGDRYYAAFEKETNEIRALLNLPPQFNSFF